MYKTSPATREGSRRESAEGEGAASILDLVPFQRAGWLWGEQITLTVGASHLDLSRSRGRGFKDS